MLYLLTIQVKTKKLIVKLLVVIKDIAKRLSLKQERQTMILTKLEEVVKLVKHSKIGLLTLQNQIMHLAFKSRRRTINKMNGI